MRLPLAITLWRCLNLTGRFTCTFTKFARTKDRRGVDLISDALPFGRLWYGGPQAVANAIGYTQSYSRSHDNVVRVYDDAGNVIEIHEYKGISKSGEAQRLRAPYRIG